MVALLNPALGVAETNALLKSCVDARTASDEVALLSLNGRNKPSFEDLTTPAACVAHAKSMAHALELSLRDGDHGAFADQARDLLAGKCLTAASAKSNEHLISAALRQATIAALKMQELHAEARFPDALALPMPVIMKGAMDRRILLIMERMRSDDCFGDVLTHDQIRLFLAGSDFEGSLNDLQALIDDEAVERFAQQRPLDTVVAVNPIEAVSAVALPAIVVPIADARGRAPVMLPVARAAQMPDCFADIATEDRSSTRPDQPEEEISLDEAWSRFQASILAEKRWTEEVTRQSIATCRYIVAILGDIKPSALGPAACERLKTTFLQLPCNYHKNPRWVALTRSRGLTSVAEAHQADIASKTAKDKTTEIKTWNKHVTNLTAFHDWCWRAVLNRAGAPPRLGLHIPVVTLPLRNRSDRERREAFYSQEQIATIFSDPVFASPDRDLDGELKYPSHYFGPLILAHTGARREEIFQLRVKHLACTTVAGRGRADCEVWYIDLKTDPLLKLKNVAAKRYIPLHDSLLALGVIEQLVRGRHPEEILFRDIDENATCKGNAPGKWLLDIYKRLGMPPRGNHKWRHTIVTHLNRAQAHDGHVEELVGHTSGDRDVVRFERYFESQRT